MTADEWQALCDLAFSFDEMPVEPAEEPPPPKKKADTEAGVVLPGQDFQERETWDDLLRDEGFDKVYTRGEVTYYRRSGKDIGVSASLNYKGSDTFYLLSAHLGINFFEFTERLKR